MNLKENQLASEVITFLCQIFILIGLAFLVATRLAEMGIQIQPSIKIVKSWGLHEDLYKNTLTMFSISSLGLLSALWFRRKSIHGRMRYIAKWTVEELRDNLKDPVCANLDEALQMNKRMLVIQTCLATSLAIHCLVFWGFFDKIHIVCLSVAPLLIIIPLRLCLSAITMATLKSKELVPRSTELLCTLDPRTWLNILRNKYENPIHSTAMSAVIGVDMLGIAYTFLDTPVICDPFFTIGSFFFALYATRRLLFKRKWILLCWAALSILCAIAGTANCYITFLM